MASEGVLIGVPSGTLALDFSAFTNIIGGDPLLPVTVTSPMCRLCNDPMHFLFRIDAPLGDSVFSRLLFAFVCARPGCLRVNPHQCFRLFRINAVNPTAAAEQCNTGRSAAVLDLDSWHIDGADDWGEEAEDSTLEMRDNSWQAPEDTPDLPSSVHTSSSSCSSFSFVRRGNAAFSASYIDVYDEPYDSTAKSAKLTEHERSLLSAYYATSDVDAAMRDLYRAAAAGDVDSEETAEDGRDARPLDDQLFSKFVRRLRACPEQVLRYNWSGKPLLAAVPDPEDLARASVCSSCGGPAVFELQITPGLLHHLKAEAVELQATLCDANVATVLVFSCVRACWSENCEIWREENCVVQAEVAAFEERNAEEEEEEEKNG